MGSFYFFSRWKEGPCNIDDNARGSQKDSIKHVYWRVHSQNRCKMYLKDEKLSSL